MLRKIKCKMLKTAPNNPRSGLSSKFTPRSNCAMLRDIARNPRATISDATGLSDHVKC